MLDAGFSELKNAFHLHGRVAENGTSPSYFLLLFYAVECGLKARILKNLNKTKLSQLEEKDDIISHDLTFMVKKLRLPLAITSENTNFHLQKDNSSYSVKYAHEAWRYGIAVNEADQRKLTDWLKQIQEWLKRNMPR
ncbi:MAG: hypothetical protein GY749_20320 [Desulfobacteraceae bacterium]|nr:hypothetical protein [Desulfobacteraceae bacterium]